jgi:FKBP-type peptidyl-prolyl cis-trans isomerase FkpA
MKGVVVLIVIIFLCLDSCRNTGEKKSYMVKPGKEELADMNNYLVQKDREKIQSYIGRKKIPAKETQSGLWYYIINEGTGKLYAHNDKVKFDYICSLLDGTECYNSKKLGPKECIIGKSELESGLNEGLRMLRPGGEAIFILPPFLAYGLLGDSKSIPPRSVIIYHIIICR